MLISCLFNKLARVNSAGCDVGLAHGDAKALGRPGSARRCCSAKAAPTGQRSEWQHNAERPQKTKEKRRTSARSWARP